MEGIFEVPFIFGINIKNAILITNIGLTLKKR
ncbi:MAG: hypothetical protein ACJAUH_001383 [Saprospiraceae bacterium]|jgi:hypothetical protein